MAEKSVVSIVKVSDSISESLNRAVDLVDGFDQLRERMNICIKPNLCCPQSPLSGHTTDPRIVEAIVDRLESMGKRRIKIVETNNSQASADRTFRILGYHKMMKKHLNTSCINLSNDAEYGLSVNGEIFSRLQVPETLLFCDCLIDVAKLKTHMDYRYTGALKNLYGLLLDRRKRPLYHGLMHKALVDLAQIYRPELCIVDAMVGMEGAGPLSGTPKHVGALIAGRDPVAVDSVGARIMGVSPSKVKHIRYAEKRGLGTTEDVEVVGCSIEEVKTEFKFIQRRYYYLGSVIPLWFQGFSIRMMNIARFLSLTRSALSTIGFSDLTNRASYAELIRLAANVILKVEA